MTKVTAIGVETGQTFLFVPANRPDRYAKAQSAGADIVIHDLEDSVSPAEKDDARRHTHAWLESGNAAMVRINAVGTQWHDDDLMLVAKSAAAVMVPKAEDPKAVVAIGRAAPGTPVVPLIETAIGVNAVAEIAATACVTRLAFGSIDLAAQLGVDPDDRDALLFARSALVMASAAAGLPSPIDGVTTSFANGEKVSNDAAYARRLGMAAKLCIHPAQVELIRKELAYSQDEIAWARKLLRAVADRGSAIAVDGVMVDVPVIHRARQILGARGPCHDSRRDDGIPAQ